MKHSFNLRLEVTRAYTCACIFLALCLPTCPPHVCLRVRVHFQCCLSAQFKYTGSMAHNQALALYCQPFADLA